MRYHIKIDVNLLAICLKHTLAKYEEKEKTLKFKWCSCLRSDLPLIML